MSGSDGSAADSFGEAGSCTRLVGVTVQRQDVKTVKNVLERHGVLHKKLKIRELHAGKLLEDGRRFVLPTTFLVDGPSDDESVASLSSADAPCDTPPELLKILQDESIAAPPCVAVITPRDALAASNPRPLQQAVRSALEAAITASPGIIDDAQIPNLVRTMHPSFYIYPPMLLLPAAAFAHPAWSRPFEALLAHSVARETFFSRLAAALGTTHVALNAPIPAMTAAGTRTDASDSATTTADDIGTDRHSASATATAHSPEENILRSPSSLTPLHGSFGPSLPPSPLHHPKPSDFLSALWVHCRQNAINQTWSPRYTMFSAGNVTEKARLLALPSVRRAVDEGRGGAGAGCAAVDLFAGIGYFAFSYARAGVGKVLCWDLNPWSLEGLRRGAGGNGWSCATLAGPAREEAGSGGAEGDGKGEKDEVGPPTCAEQDLVNTSATFLLFCESNVCARARLARMRSRLPPIRHINCGMLPTIGEAWRVAVFAVDPVLGGWVHLHETVDERGMEERVGEIVTGVEGCWRGLGGKEAEGGGVRLEHVERVKSMGVRLWHVVLDIWVPPRVGGGSGGGDGGGDGGGGL